MIGESVELKLVEQQDLPNLIRWHNAAHNRERRFAPFLATEYAQKKWFDASLKDQSRVHFVIIRREGNLKIGTVSLENINFRNQDCTLGPFIMDASEPSAEAEVDAGETLLRYAFLSLNMHRVESKVLAFDEAELEIRERLGLVRERTERQAIFMHGKFVDVIALGILREEWDAGQREARELSPQSVELSEAI